MANFIQRNFKYSNRLTSKVGKYIDARTIKLFTNLEKSHGSFLVDADNNKYLDVFNNIASLPLGYNHPNLIKALNTNETITLLAQRAAMGVTPPMNIVNKIELLMRNVAPKGMDYVHLGCGCGSGANENAFKAAFLYHAKTNDDTIATETELHDTTMMNMTPGSPDWQVLSFSSGFHGRTLGCLSATRSKADHKVHIPAFKWPVAPFPKLKYPLDRFISENQQAEESCLHKTKCIMKENNVVAMIVEPVQAEGGDNHASPHFFRSLRQMCLDNNITFIVDEVQTGVGSSGYMWAHESWDLETPPDIVTFAKKMQIAGYFCTKKYMPNKPYQIYNTWLGDPVRLVMANTIAHEIHYNRLLNRVSNVGKYLMDEMSNMPHLKNVRGIGTFIAFDCDNNIEFANKMLNNGVLVGPCGTHSIRIRPNLLFSYPEVDLLLYALYKMK